MDIVRKVHSMQETARRTRAASKVVGFVPTMGFLHEGHLSLIRAARERSDVVVVSVFVNPTQFGPREDFDRYPRDLARDADLCIAAGVDHLFVPEAADVYPPGGSTVVEVQGLSTRLEGASRPGHFRGVTTVVLKLLQVVQPHLVVFGQKDAQQAIIVRRMVRDLLLGVEVLVEPTVRAEDGVALSSRNHFLSEAERRAARAIPRSLEAAARLLAEGERDAKAILGTVRETLAAEPVLRVDYAEIVDTSTLEPVSGVDGEALLAVAVFAGRTRLIDNALLRI